MDRNLFLAFALSIAVMMGWMALTGPPPSQMPPGEEQHSPEIDPIDGVERSLPPSTTVVEQPSPLPVTELPQFDSPQPSVRLISIDMPLYTVELTSRGAGIASWVLKEFRETSDKDSPRIELTTGQAPFDTALVTPFNELGLGDFSQYAFQVLSEEPAGVSFEATEAGITIRKTYSFDADSYSFRVLIEVENESTASIAPRFRIDLPAHVREGSDFRELALAALEDGSTVTEQLQSLGRPGFLSSFTGDRPEPYQDYLGEIDWAGIQTTYFLSVILPDTPAQAGVRMAATEAGVSGAVQVFFAETAIPPGQSAARELRGYMGPKEMARLEALGSETVRAIDLGWSWVQPLTRFFSVFLKMLYSAIPNYGVAIIILTILVRLVTTPLTIKQMRSMERMRALSPKLKEIQAKHADDRQKQSEQTMALYKSEGVNPLGGCLPMLLQFPVFIGLFYALRSTIQLRQSPFVGWINDLSVPEELFEIPGLGLPFRVLPLVMGATMVLQQKITPVQADPAQAKMMMTVMPIMMTFVFYQFPSGLVLYWMVSNVLAISHQLIIGRDLRAKAAS
jgi:YidC/Oxa1 family membrane protein insertase